MTSTTFTIPSLETDRLILRAPSVNDLDAEAEFHSTDRAEFVGGKMPREQVFKMLATFLGHWAIRGFGFWGVDEKFSGRYVGHVGLWYPQGWPEREIGWSVMGWAEGKGFAFEAAKAAREYAYGTLNWTTAISLIATQNIRSQALAKRLGATQDGGFKHERLGDSLIFRHPSPEMLASQQGDA